MELTVGKANDENTTLHFKIGDFMDRYEIIPCCYNCEHCGSMRGDSGCKLGRFAYTELTSDLIYFCPDLKFRITTAWEIVCLKNLYVIMKEMMEKIEELEESEQLSEENLITGPENEG